MSEEKPDFVFEWEAGDTPHGVTVDGVPHYEASDGWRLDPTGIGHRPALLELARLKVAEREAQKADSAVDAVARMIANAALLNLSQMHPYFSSLVPGTEAAARDEAVDQTLDRMKGLLAEVTPKPGADVVLWQGEEPDAELERRVTADGKLWKRYLNSAIIAPGWMEDSPTCAEAELIRRLVAEHEEQERLDAYHTGQMEAIEEFDYTGYDTQRLEARLDDLKERVSTLEVARQDTQRVLASHLRSIYALEEQATRDAGRTNEAERDVEEARDLFSRTGLGDKIAEIRAREVPITRAGLIEALDACTQQNIGDDLDAMVDAVVAALGVELAPEKPRLPGKVAYNEYCMICVDGEVLQGEAFHAWHEAACKLWNAAGPEGEARKLLEKWTSVAEHHPDARVYLGWSDLRQILNLLEVE